LCFFASTPDHKSKKLEEFFMRIHRTASFICSSSIAVLLLLFVPVTASASAIVPFKLTNTLPATDDGSTPAVPLGLDTATGINLLGGLFTDVYVNNNGNVTFGSPLSQFTPNGLASGVGFPIIAPFFADVDTRGKGSGVVTYGNATYNGRSAFVVDWPNVGYYDSHTNKLDNFQLILIDRSDTGSGNFDIEFNYGKIQWETGDASGGVNGLGGTSAVAGYSNGLSGTLDIYYQLPGSLVNGALLDGGPDSLVGHHLNSKIPGRYDFQVRNGNVIGTPEPATLALIAVGLLSLAASRRRAR
jgi:hypothetical protein